MQHVFKKTLFLLFSLYFFSSNVSSADLGESVLATPLDDVDSVKAKKMLNLIATSENLQSLTHNENKRSLILYVEKEGLLDDPSLSPLDLSADEYEKKIHLSRTATLTTDADIDKSIRILEILIPLQKRVLVHSYRALCDLAAIIYGAALEKVEGKLIPGVVLLDLAEDENRGQSGGIDIIVSRLMIKEIGESARKNRERKATKNRNKGKSSARKDHGSSASADGVPSLESFAEMKQSVWQLANQEAWKRLKPLSTFQTMKEFAVDISYLGAAEGFLDALPKAEGKLHRLAKRGNFGHISLEEIRMRIRLAQDSVDLALGIKDEDRIRKSVSLLISLKSVLSEKLTDQKEIANAYLEAARTAEAYIRYMRDEDFLIAAPLHYFYAFVRHPDKDVREEIVGSLCRILPETYEAYYSLKEKLAPRSTKDVLDFVDRLRRAHIKILLLKKNHEASERLLPAKTTALPPAAPHATAGAGAGASSRPTAVVSDATPFVETDLSPERQEYVSTISMQDQLRQAREEARKNARDIEERETRKQALKELKRASALENMGAETDPEKSTSEEGASATAEPSSDDDTSSILRQKLPLKEAAYKIFRKFFFLKGDGGPVELDVDVPLSVYDSLTFEDGISVTPAEFKKLVQALDGTTRSAKGSHSTAKIPSITGVLSHLIELDEGLLEEGVHSQTVTYTQSDFLPFYQIEQIRNKLLALGYSLHTVESSKKK